MRRPRTDPLTVIDDRTLLLDDATLITRTRAWTCAEVPLVPFAFAAQHHRDSLAASATSALSALRKGHVLVKSVQLPTDPAAVRAERDALARRTGDPGEAWPELLAHEEAAVRRVQSARKRVYLFADLGPRSPRAQAASLARRAPLAPVSRRELAGWHRIATAKRATLTESGLRAVPVDRATTSLLRRHALWRSTGVPPDVAGQWWSLRDDFAEVEITAAARSVRVASPAGICHTATFVMGTFPVDMTGYEPWVAHLDGLPFPVESDLHLELIGHRRAKFEFGRRQTVVSGQAMEARQAGARVPLATQEADDLGQEIELELARSRDPWVRGWATIRVDVADPADLPAAYEAVRDRMAKVGPPGYRGIDVAWPGGAAQRDLLLASIPGWPVRHKSWVQWWPVRTVGASLPHAASNLGDGRSAYVGKTTGRMLEAVRWSPHTGIRHRDAAGKAAPRQGGTVLFGTQRAGKSTVLAQTIVLETVAGNGVVALDPPGPFARLAKHPWVQGRVRVFNLVEDAAGGLVDPLGPYVVPDPPPMADEDAYRREWAKVRARRVRLSRTFLSILLRRELASSAHPDAETLLLRAIHTAVDKPGASLHRLVGDLAGSDHADARYLGEHLTLLAQDPDLGMAFGSSSVRAREEQTRASETTSILTMPGIVLPRPGVGPDDWSVDEQIGAGMATLGLSFARRLLWDTGNRPGTLIVDEAHVLLAYPDGRREIESTLRNGPKEMKATIVATHNPVDMADERLVGACSTKMLFRVEADRDLELGLPVLGREDTATNRALVRGFVAGECLAVFPDGTADRMRWDREWIPGLAELAGTDPDALEGMVPA